MASTTVISVNNEERDQYDNNMDKSGFDQFGDEKVKCGDQHEDQGDNKSCTYCRLWSLSSAKKLSLSTCPVAGVSSCTAVVTAAAWFGSYSQYIPTRPGFVHQINWPEALVSYCVPQTILPRQGLRPEPFPVNFG